MVPAAKLLPQAMALATSIASFSMPAVAAIKDSVNRACLVHVIRMPTARRGSAGLWAAMQALD